MIANAAYLKAAWQEPFDERATSNDDFATARGRSRIKMMHARRTIPYATIPGGKLVEIPYRNGLSLTVVLSDSPAGLDDMERRAGREYLSWHRALAVRRVDLRIPESPSSKRIA